MSSARFLHYQSAFREKYVWLLLPLFFAICFLPDNRTGATNLYRLFVFLPVLFCFRPGDWVDIWGNWVARIFLLLCGWMLASIIWSEGDPEKIDNYIYRALSTLTLFYLIYLVNRYHPRRQRDIIKSFLVFGVLGAVLILLDWGGFENLGDNYQHARSARGIFNHHSWVGWTMAILTTVGLWLWIHEKSHKWFYGLAFFFLLFVTFLVQARSGYLVAAIGIAVTLGLQWRRSWLKPMIAAVVVIAALCLVFFEPLMLILNSLVERGTSHRIAIWLNAVEAITRSPEAFLFGHGALADAANTVKEMTRPAEHYHNFYLNIWFHVGFVGLGLYLVAQVAVMIKTLRDPELRLWGILLVAIQGGFIPDGVILLVNPSAMMLAVLLPLFYGIFGSASKRLGGK